MKGLYTGSPPVSVQFIVSMCNFSPFLMEAREEASRINIYVSVLIHSL